MKLNLRAFYNSFKAFVRTDGRRVLFAILFYALWVVFNSVEGADTGLDHFKGRMIGTATLSALDIGSRVMIYYKALFTFVFSCSLFYIVGYFLFKKWPFLVKSREMSVINYSALAGLLFFLYHVYNGSTQLFSSVVSQSLEMIYFLHKFMIAAFFLRIGLGSRSGFTIPASFYAVVIVLSVCMYFFIADLFFISGSDAKPDFLLWVFLVSALQLVVVTICVKRREIAAQHEFIRKWTDSFLPLVPAPLISVLGVESFIVLHNKGLLSQQFIPALILWLSVISLVVFRFLSSGRKNTSVYRILSQKYFPVFIFGLVSFLFYRPFTELTAEAFEAANKYLPVMEFGKWGTIPILEKFNSHVLSDFFFSSVCAFVNGSNGNDLEVYDFLNIALYAVLGYYLFLFVTRNAWVSFFLVALFPYFLFVCPTEHCIAVVFLFGLIRVLESPPSVKNYCIFFLLLFVVLCWRIDAGVACLFSAPFILAYYHVSESGKTDWRLLLKGFFIVGLSLFFLCLIISFSRGFSLLQNAGNILHYLSSAQSYGYRSMGSGPLYIMDYFVLPFVILLITVCAIFTAKKFRLRKNQRITFLSILFLCLYYFMNAQRGMVRHSLLEGIDTFISSFAYLIVPGSIYLFIKKKHGALRFISFSLILFFFLFHYKNPVIKDSLSFFEASVLKIREPAKDVSGIKRDKAAISICPELVDFIKEHTGPDETFIEFSNHSMLYYYAQKSTPSFFFQNPICSHDDHLQEQLINDFKKYKTPFAVMGPADPLYNRMDGVPNYLRHYRVAEYLYNNFEPFAVINDFNVWKEKNGKKKLNDTVLFRYEAKRTDTTGQVIKTRVKCTKGRYLTFRMKGKGPENFEMQINSAPAVPYYLSKNPATGIYIIRCQDSNIMDVRLKNQNIIELSISEHDYTPWYKLSPESWDIEKLPYIWANYDKDCGEEKTLFEKKLDELLNPADSLEIKFPFNIDRSSGNTVLITVDNPDKAEQRMLLSYGETNQVLQLSFTLMKMKKAVYALRISAFAAWYLQRQSIFIKSLSSQPVRITNFKITKGS